MSTPIPGAVNSLYNIITAFITSKAEPAQIAQARRLMMIGYTVFTGRNIADKSITFRVRNDNNAETHTVIISDFYTMKFMKTGCTCTEGELCRHRLSSLIYIAERLTDSQAEIAGELLSVRRAGTPAPMKEVEIKMPAINVEILGSVTNRYDISIAMSFVSQKKVNILRAEKMEIDAEVTNLQTVFNVKIKKTDDDTFFTYCNCPKASPVVCEHRYAVFYHLLLNKGKFYFETFKDQAKIKNALIAEYGYSAKDNIDDKFEFSFNPGTGKPELKLKDESLQKISKYQNWEEVIRQLKLEEKNLDPVDAYVPEVTFTDEFGIGFAFNFNRTQFPFYVFSPFRAKLSKDRSSAVNSFAAFPCYDPPHDIYTNTNQKRIFHILQDITNEQLLKYQHSVTGNVYRQYRGDTFGYTPFTADEKSLLMDYIHSRFLQIFPLLQKEPYVYTQLYHGNLSAHSINKINISAGKIRLVFKLEFNEDTTDLSMALKKSDGTMMEGIQFFADMFILEGNTLYLISRADDSALIKFMGKNHKIKVHKKDSDNFIRSFVLPLQKYFDVEMPEKLTIPGPPPDRITFGKRVYLRELNNKFLVIRPAFCYNNKHIVGYGDASQIVEEQHGKFSVLHRNIIEEDAFREKIADFHPAFRAQMHRGFFHISFEDALKDSWFFRFNDLIKEQNADIYGLKEMKKFRYNPNTAKITLSVGTGIDWFDVKIEISFGDQYVKLKDLRKAVLKDQNYVLLDDGSVGMLPEEWSKKYSLLFKMGNVENEALKVSKFHFSIIDEMYDQIDNEQIRRELDHKRNKLKNFNRIEDIDLPDKVDATLRVYQKAGFNWFNFLDEFGWGGILADDMGLGKTLQALTFIQFLKNNRNALPAEKPAEQSNSELQTASPELQIAAPEPHTHLIVCPNSLMFNWENEIKKFCPDLAYHIQHGNDRIKDVKQFANFDIIITTYGTIRSDFETFTAFTFNYIILDESQAIKNPASKSTKAVQLLKGKNRLALSGTPVQNNIFDLYAQMNFLNPGMLGNIEFFKNEFAFPIDKHRDEGKKETLRKLIYPFLLRRTKEQVAKELPKKTETVLYCEMGAEQRKVYEAYRNDYRDRIMKRIAEDGLEKSGIYVLQGLMKLRQICDSPAILNEDEIFSHQSVKLEELTREISENIGEHKVLVFSQFIGMLQLIKKRLDKHHIKYTYLDGQSTDRKESVELFQSDPSYKVFLISLKAGGVGINLTAADYVYIVDPWWNPAVEQQAIDRTHRIGQSRSIFAYKMICKETIEEKILQLQEKKRTFAKEIVSDDSAFLKNLSKEDIGYLFS